MQLSTAILCDFAQVRDGLLFVSSGAISRLYRRALPAPLGVMVGLVIEIPVEDAGAEHELVAQVINRRGEELAVVRTAFRVGDHDLFPHEVQQAPTVISLTGVETASWGTHQVRLYLDGACDRTLTFYVVPTTVGPVPLRQPAEEPARAAAPEAPDEVRGGAEEVAEVAGPPAGPAEPSTAPSEPAGPVEPAEAPGAAEAPAHPAATGDGRGGHEPATPEDPAAQPDGPARDDPDRDDTAATEPAPVLAVPGSLALAGGAADRSGRRPVGTASAWLLRARRAWRNL